MVGSHTEGLKKQQHKTVKLGHERLGRDGRLPGYFTEPTDAPDLDL